MSDKIPVSLVILTYNRTSLIRQQLAHLSEIKYLQFEVIVVDNHSKEDLTNIVRRYPIATLHRMEANLGIAGRNHGFKAAQGDIVITLDDDVTGITDRDIDLLIKAFQDPEIGAVCFKVLDEETGKIINWCHHRKQEEYSNQTFVTDEISEGAVAFRRSAVLKAGLYPEDFFISHEGHDLALRLMNCGYYIIYNPSISVRHGHAALGRPEWRRYYYDTRNLIWLVLRNYPVFLGMKRLTIGLGTMFIYSLRDGFVVYWLRGIKDGIQGSKNMLSQRTPMTVSTRNILKEIASYRPSVWYMIKKRLFNKKVRI